MTVRELIAAAIAQMGESLAYILNFFESVLKAAIGRALALVLAGSVLLGWVLAYQHAEEFTHPLLVQARDTLIAVMRATQADAEAGLTLRSPPGAP